MALLRLSHTKKLKQ